MWPDVKWLHPSAMDEVLNELLVACEDNLETTSSEVDLAIGHDASLRQEVLRLGPDTFPRVLGLGRVDDLEGEGAGIAVRKGDDKLREEFNAAIKAIRDNGVYQKINAKYFEFDIFGG